VDQETGILEWRYQPRRPLGRAIAASNGNDYVSPWGSPPEGGYTYLLDAETGNLNWRGACGINCNRMKVVDDVLYGAGRQVELGHLFFAIRFTPDRGQGD